MRDDAVARNDALDAKLEDNPIVTDLVKVSRQHGLILKVLVGSLVFDFLLSGAIFVLSVRSSDNANQANRAVKAATSAQAQAYNQCLAGNDSRHSQLQLWEFILSIPPDPHLTAEQAHTQHVESVKFRGFVERKLAPRDCKHLKPIRTKSDAIHFKPFPQQSEQAQRPTSTTTTVVPPNHQVAPSPQPARSPQPTKHASASPKNTATPTPSPTPTCSRVPLLGICKPTLAPHPQEAVVWTRPSPPTSTNSALGAALVAVVLQGSLLCGYVTLSLLRRRTLPQQTTSPASATGASMAMTSTVIADQRQ